MNTIMKGMGSCRGCGASIRWLKTTEGNNMPVNPETTMPEDTIFDGKKHVPHWATCPDSNDFRKVTVGTGGNTIKKKPCNCGQNKNESTTTQTTNENLFSSPVRA